MTAREPVIRIRRPAPMPGPFARFILLAWIVVMLMACSPAVVASFLPTASGPLVTVTTRGGECPEGACGRTTVIERDGRVYLTAPADAELGMLPAEILTALDTAVKTTDFEVIRARKFTGECPTAYDGQEVIYEFGAHGRTERIASCEIEIDQNAPLFVSVTAALEAVGAVPRA